MQIRTKKTVWSRESLARKKARVRKTMGITEKKNF